MTWPPSIMRLHLAGRKRTLRLWLPIVLVWPLALVLGIALAPLALLAALLLGLTPYWLRGRRRPSGGPAGAEPSQLAAPGEQAADGPHPKEN